MKLAYEQEVTLENACYFLWSIKQQMQCLKALRGEFSLDDYDELCNLINEATDLKKALKATMLGLECF